MGLELRGPHVDILGSKCLPGYTALKAVPATMRMRMTIKMALAATTHAAPSVWKSCSAKVILRKYVKCAQYV